MSVQKILYVNKQTSQVSPLPEIEKATAANYNEIKDVVNFNADVLNALGAGGVDIVYADIAAMLSDQVSQTDNAIYEVIDASTDATVDADSAWYRYKGTTAGDLTDYEKMSEEEAFTENAGSASSGANNEIQTSDGAGGFTSDKVFSNNGNIILGDSGLAGSRIISIESSNANQSLTLKYTGGTGAVVIANNSDTTGKLFVGDNTSGAFGFIKIDGNSASVESQLQILSSGIAGSLVQIQAATGSDSYLQLKGGSTKRYAIGTDNGTSDEFVIAFGTTSSTKPSASSTKRIRINDIGIGLFDTTPAAQPAHIVDADGTLADITTKFNTLLAQLATLGIQAAS